MTSKAANDFNDDGCKAMADVADLSEELVQHCLVSCDFFASVQAPFWETAMASTVL